MRAFTGLLVLTGLAAGAWQFAYWEPRLLPIRVVEVQGELHHDSSEILQRAMGERVRGGILTADLRDLKQAADRHSWVGGASIRRVWPDRLQVRVQEHKPLARWNDGYLVTAEGLVFEPRVGSIPAGLPTLEGEDGQAPGVVARYLRWRDDLMLVGHLIQILGVDARGAWSLELVSGPRLELGTEQVEQRMRRFLANVAQLEAAGRPRIVDLRYSNGLSVTWARSAMAEAQSRSTPEAVAVKAEAQSVASKGPRSKGGKARASKSRTPGAKAMTATKAAPTKAATPKATVTKGASPKVTSAQAASPKVTSTKATSAKASATTTDTSKAPKAAQIDRTVRSAKGG